MVGLRGVGKTVLLDSIREAAEGSGIQTVRMEAPENRSLPALLAPELRGALLRLSRNQQAKELAQRGLRALAGFAKGLKILADNGDLEQDLPALLEAVARSAQSAGTALAMFIDELQYVDEAELAALITALHRCAQRQLPVVLVGAGVPQLRGRMGKAKSYAERRFEFPEVGPLPPDAAALAMTRPAEKEGIRFTPDAVHEIVRQTKGYPYFLQEWGKHAWDVATASPITFADVTVGAVSAVAALDASFFRVRFDRLTPAEKKYLRAMADIGPGPHRSGDIAERLSRKVTALGPTRNQLISKGMIWSPNHGDTAFTVPLFDEFMRRIMPGDGWKTSKGN